MYTSALLYVANSTGSAKKVQKRYIHIYVYMYVIYITSPLEDIKTLNTNTIINERLLTEVCHQASLSK